MGVKSLSSYIKEHLGDVLQYQKLHNCNVIIDGNNLAHVLYYECPEINAAFGGDYDRYATYVKEYFEKLNSCEVYAIVLMDGGQPLDSKKFRTVRERTLGQIQGCLHVKPSNQSTYKIFPSMARQVFVSVLKSMNIPVYQTDFEADLEIATLAVKYDLKVISCDSDFYIFDVEFVRLDSIYHKKVCKDKTDRYNYLPCKSFSIERFCELTGMDAQHMPLLATLLGNDYIAFDYFIGFYDFLRQERKRSKYMSDRHNTIKDVIAWLAKHKGKPTEHLIKKIVKHTKAPRLSSTIKKSIANYTSLQSNLASYIQHRISTSNTEKRVSDKGRKKLRERSPKIVSDLVLKGGEKLPSWFTKAYRLHTIPHEVADIMTQRYFISPPHVEVEQMPSSYLVVRPIVKSVFTMLWRGVLESTDDSEVGEVSMLESEMDSEIPMLEHEEMEAFDFDNSDVIIEEGSDEELQCAKGEDKGLLYDGVGKRITETKSLEKVSTSKAQENFYNYIQSIPNNGTLKNKRAGNKKTGGKVKKNTAKRLQLRWYMRKGRDFKTEMIYITANSLQSSLPSISEIHNMSLSDKKAVFLFLLNSSSSSPEQDSVFRDMDMPADMELILTYIIYWMKNTNFNLKDNHTLAVLMCVFMFYIIDGKIGRLRTRKSDQKIEEYRAKLQEIQGSEGYFSESAGVKQLLAHISMEECLIANSRLLKFHRMNPNVDDNTYNKKIVHAFSEYQVCIYFVQLLNSLLGTPFPMLSVECLWGGTFCYNAYISLKKNANPLMVVSKLLGIGTCLEMLFLKLFRRLGETLKFQKTADMVDPVASRSISKAEEKRQYAKAGGAQKLTKKKSNGEKDKTSNKSSERKHTNKATSDSQVSAEDCDMIRAKMSCNKERPYALNNRFANLIIDSDDEDEEEEENLDANGNENDDDDDEEYFSA